MSFQSVGCCLSPISSPLVSSRPGIAVRVAAAAALADAIPLREILHRRIGVVMPFVLGVLRLGRGVLMLARLLAIRLRLLIVSRRDRGALHGVVMPARFVLVAVIVVVLSLLGHALALLFVVADVVLCHALLSRVRRTWHT